MSPERATAAVYEDGINRERRPNGIGFVNESLLPGTDDEILQAFSHTRRVQNTYVSLQHPAFSGSLSLVLTLSLFISLTHTHTATATISQTYFES